MSDRNFVLNIHEESAKLKPKKKDETEKWIGKFHKSKVFKNLKEFQNFIEKNGLIITKNIASEPSTEYQTQYWAQKMWVDNVISDIEEFKIIVRKNNLIVGKRRIF